MSFSFSVRAASATLIAAAIAAEFDKVVEAQPIHDLDRAVGQEAATELVNLVGEVPEGKEVAVNVSGSVGKAHDAVVSLSFNVYVSVVDVPAETETA